MNKLTSKQIDLLSPLIFNGIEAISSYDFVSNESLVNSESLQVSDTIDALINKYYNRIYNWSRSQSIINKVYVEAPHRLVELLQNKQSDALEHLCLFVAKLNNAPLKESFRKYLISSRDIDLISLGLKYFDNPQEIIVQFIECNIDGIPSLVAEKLDKKYLHFHYSKYMGLSFTKYHFMNKYKSLTAKQCDYILRNTDPNDFEYIEEVIVLLMMKLSKKNLKKFTISKAETISRIAMVLYNPELLVLE